MEEQKYLYAVFVSSPYRMGKFIRMATGYPYNHAAVSFSPEPEKMYSFSRKYKNAPFYGGFTEESVLRLKNRGKTAKIKICAVPVSDEGFSKAKKRIALLREHSDEYIYNMISAAVFPLGVCLHIEKSYTCVEFVLSMLKKYADIPVLKEKEFCSVKELSEILEPYKIYEGGAEKFFCNAKWGKDSFPMEKGKAFYIKNTIKNNGKLLRRFFKNRRNKPINNS